MNTSRSRFAHRRLDAYRVALELYEGVERMAASFPAGFADLKDQLRRAAGATVRNIAEGANRVLPRDKAARFTIARGEVGECDAALDMAAIAGLPSDDIDALRRLADRVAAMLRGLARREEARARSP
jgi:four helix bundle protein